MDFGVSDLRKVNVFLGHDWLKIHNPHIDWEKNSIEFDRCPPKCWSRSMVQEPEEEREELSPEEEGQIIAVYIGDEEIRKVSPQIQAYQSKAGEIAEKKVIQKRPLDEVIPRHYLKHRKVFEKTTFAELPPR